MGYNTQLILFQIEILFHLFSISCRGKNVLVPILSKQMSQRHWKEVDTAQSSDNWEKSATK